MRILSSHDRALMNDLTCPRRLFDLGLPGGDEVSTHTFSPRLGREGSLGHLARAEQATFHVPEPSPRPAAARGLRLKL